MKFFVVVNNNYLLVVDAETNGGAEHKLLDNFHYCIEQCQAFKHYESEIMFEMFPNLNTTSLSRLHLMNVEAEIKYHLDKSNEHMNKVEQLKKQLSYAYSADGKVVL